MDGFYSIGAFSKIVQISIKALRFYESAGLLAPARTDPNTGYRYFSEEQIPLANAIVTLRATGMAVAEVAATVGGSPSQSYTEVLRERHRALLKERQELEQRIALVETLLRSGAAPSPYRLIPCDPILTLQRTVSPDGGDSIAATFDALERTAATKGARAPAAPFCELTDEGAWRVCVPITDSAGDEPDAEFVGSAGVVCSNTYIGPYGQTQPALTDMRAWLHRHQIAALTPAREVYHRFGADQDGYALPAHVLASKSDHYVTELQLPIQLPRAEPQ